jgi:hypothetical protein
VTDLFRIERDNEVAADADAMHIGITIRKGGERISPRQSLE